MRVLMCVLLTASLSGCVDDAPDACKGSVEDLYRLEAGQYSTSDPVPGVPGSSDAAIVFSDDLGQIVYSFTVNGRRYKARYQVSSSVFRYNTQD